MLKIIHTVILEIVIQGLLLKELEIQRVNRRILNLLRAMTIPLIITQALKIKLRKE